MGSIATDEEAEIVSAFLQAQSLPDEELRELDQEDLQEWQGLRFQRQLRAFRKGIERSQGL